MINGTANPNDKKEKLTMNFLDLQAFVTIYDCRDITEAARRLCITQPALSRRIRDLEKELGVTLFVRRSNGIEITEVGLRLYQDAVHLLDQKENLIIKAQRLQNSRVGTLQIAVALGMPFVSVLRAVSAMARDYPELTQIFNGALFEFPKTRRIVTIPYLSLSVNECSKRTPMGLVRENLLSLSPTPGLE